ncbi:MAG: hypothetical protein IKO80_08530 [Lachnospiraceae bacterium]|nr:hypothetical protein [Lachnospiraceae bacterium]
MADSNRRGKILRYPRGIQQNIGLIIFAVLLVYLIITIYGYMHRKHVIGYEVKEGALSSANIYEGITIRKEKIITSDAAGYVNYFATEGRRVAVGNLVYTIDASGRLLDYLNAEGADNLHLTAENLRELRTQIVNFEEDFSPAHFRTVYDFRIGLDGTVQKLSNNNILADIRSLNAGETLSSITYRNAAESGIVVYSTDGYEELEFGQIHKEHFASNEYEKHQLVGNALVEPGDPVYKLVTSQDWALAIPVESEERAQALLDEDYIKVRFLKNQYESWGKVSTKTDDDGNAYVLLTFNNSMSAFCTDRYLTVELILNDNKGLKIPNTAIVERSFYLVPLSYLTSSGGKEGVLRSIYNEDGTESTEFVETVVYNKTETDVYLDQAVLRSGDRLIRPESAGDTYTVSRQDSMIGVYNINKGYADFRRIRILFQNDEYAIVAPGTAYGLNAYDYIVLDTSTVDDNELIFE